jgi:toxin-antitoxin system PIN domain toxin
MMLIDANLLLYAYHSTSEQHKASKAWLETALSGTELVRFAWLTLWAFLRISTNPRAFEHPLSIAESQAAISSWLDQPVAGILEPGDRHLDILRKLMKDGQTVGPLVMDAALAALAIEHGANLCTTDRDFSRFADLKWTNPIARSAAS